MEEDCKANWQRMAADWNPANSFNTLVLHLFTGMAFVRYTNFRMANHDIVNIGLHIIKR